MSGANKGKRNIWRPRKNICHPKGKSRRGQRRAAHFKTRCETQQRITLIDAYGNRKLIEKQGRLGRTKHKTLLAALQERSRRFSRGKLTEDDLDQIIYTEALDETGTVATEGLTGSEDESSNTTEGEDWEDLLRGVD